MNARQEIARLLADALCVRQMTRILVRRAKVEAPEPLAGDLSEVLVHVADLRRERGRALAPCFVVGEQRAVALQLRAASGGVDDHEIDGGLLERADVAASQLPRVVALAGMCVKRAAARLRWSVDRGDALSRENAAGCGVDVAVRDAHHASEQESHARTGSGRGAGGR